ncbi:glutathione S-transferase family protein [Hyphococcus sp.]|uniref:glutathione S-transferase family protein n=1 Tax=Hyphococcus sp. TaxID=2038636 RepID=UPI003CCBC36F
MLHYFSFPSPNCLKAAIMLEECALTYRVHHVDILSGAQFDRAYLRLNPNNKVPALVDEAANGGPVTLFESGAILEYLAEKTGRFFPAERRWDVKTWLYWQMAGLGPMAGQAHHFRAFAGEHVPYAIKRYTDEVNRLYGVLDRRLENRDYIADELSIADFACWPWISHHERQGQALPDFPNIDRWYRAIGEREGVQRAVAKGAEQAAPKEAYKFLYGQTASSAEKISREKSEP